MKKHLSIKKFGSWLANVNLLTWEYKKFNRLTAYQINKIILCFCEDIAVPSAIKILKLNFLAGMGLQTIYH